MHRNITKLDIADYGKRDILRQGIRDKYLSNQYPELGPEASKAARGTGSHLTSAKGPIAS